MPEPDALAFRIAENNSIALTSGPIPTFAFHCSSRFANVGIKGPLEIIDSSGALDLTFAYERPADL
jgi:hypothetical protein